MGILIPKHLMSPFSRTNRKRNAQVSSLSPALSIKKDKRHEMAHIFATQKTQKSQNPKRATEKNQNPFWRHPTELAPHRRPATPVARVGLGATPKTRGCRPKAPAKKKKKKNAPQKTKKEGASSSVPVVEAKRRRAGPSKYPRKPRYWGDQIQALDTAARSAARHLVEITHQHPSRTRTPDDTTSIAVLRDSHKKAQDHLYVALKSAQHEAECKRVLDIVNGFEEAGTAATNHVGGGGHIKRAWDRTYGG
jgi:hypothetical protein